MKVPEGSEAPSKGSKQKFEEVPREVIVPFCQTSHEFVELCICRNLSKTWV